MNPIIESVFAEDPPAVFLGELEISTVSGVGGDMCAERLFFGRGHG